MTKATRSKDDGRFSDPVPILRKDKDGNIISGTPEAFARAERMREGMAALQRGDRKTYERLVWGED